MTPLELATRYLENAASCDSELGRVAGANLRGDLWRAAAVEELRKAAVELQTVGRGKVAP